MAATIAGMQPGQALDPVINVGRAQAGDKCLRPSRSEEEVVEQVLEVPLSPRGSFGALVRECRHQAFLSQEQLAERAELSERTVRNLEAERVLSPRAETVRLLADALELSGPERAGWFAAARGLDHRPTVPAAGGPVQLPGGVPARRPGDAPGWGTGNQRWRRWCPAAGSGTGIASPGRRGAWLLCAGRGGPGCPGAGGR